MSKQKSGADLATTTGVHTELAALADVSGLGEVMRANVGDQGVSLSALETIKVPSGNTPAFVTENEVDGIETVKEFEAVLCWWQDVRLWWATSADERDSATPEPPSCQSRDLRTGVGDNGTGDGEHECASCPQNRFGSATIESDHYCKEMRQLFVLRKDRPEVVFPSLLRIPPTSLKPVRRYMMALATRGLPYYAVLHKFTLTPAKNAKGIDYSTVKMSMVRKLEPEEIQAVVGYAGAMKEAFQRVDA